MRDTLEHIGPGGNAYEGHKSVMYPSDDKG